MKNGIIAKLSAQRMVNKSSICDVLQSAGVVKMVRLFDERQPLMNRFRLAAT